MSISLDELGKVAKAKFDELSRLEDWRSFYNGYLEGYIKGLMDQKKSKRGES